MRDLVTVQAKAVPAEPAADVLTIARTQAELPLPMMMRKVAADYGTSFNQMLADIVRLGFGPGKVSVEEYFNLRLFDTAALAGADKRAFVGFDGMRRIWEEVNHDRTWCAVLTDKLASTTLLGGYGFPVIPIPAIYSQTLSFPGGTTQILRSPDALRAHMLDPTHYPMFGKPTDSLQSLGSASFDGLDAETGMLTTVDGRAVLLDEFIADVTTHYAGGYLLQKRLSPHAAIRAICGDRLATVRIVTINPKSGPQILRACWKIPAGPNAADNFWRPGNLLGTIDLETGRIGRVVSGVGLKQSERLTHPDTGSVIEGFELPVWAEAKALALDAMKVFQQMGMIGWDIALTDNGPVIVEPNWTPDLALPQIADRRGVLDDQFRGFLAERTCEAARQLKSVRRDLRKEHRDNAQRVIAGAAKG